MTPKSSNDVEKNGAVAIFHHETNTKPSTWCSKLVHSQWVHFQFYLWSSLQPINQRLCSALAQWTEFNGLDSQCKTKGLNKVQPKQANCAHNTWKPKRLFFSSFFFLSKMPLRTQQNRKLSWRWMLSQRGYVEFYPVVTPNVSFSLCFKVNLETYSQNKCCDVLDVSLTEEIILTWAAVANPNKTLIIFCQRAKGTKYVFLLLETPELFFSAVTMPKMHKELLCLEHCPSMTQFSDFFFF